MPTLIAAPTRIQAVIAHASEWVQYSTPGPDGTEHVAVCLPAFAPQLVHRRRGGGPVAPQRGRARSVRDRGKVATLPGFSLTRTPKTETDG
ncbi:MAG: hypothetical protein IT429_20585 [Gemmataceae bacterium]|nr:hypothetical protein [Gemmataceae bacterium]